MWKWIGIVALAAFAGTMFGVVGAAAWNALDPEIQEETIWDEMTPREQKELCEDYNVAGEDGMRELMDLLSGGTMSEEREARLDEMIKAAEVHC